MRICSWSSKGIIILEANIVEPPSLKMVDSDHFNVKWANFENDMGLSLKVLREDTEFSDVTLVCEDGQQIEAHRFVLATGSIFFQNLLKSNSKHGHPLIYMRGLKYETLTAVVDFLYCGEVAVPHGSVESFLMLVDDLKLRGVSESGPNKTQSEHELCLDSQQSDFYKEHSKDGKFESIQKLNSNIDKEETFESEDKESSKPGEFKNITKQDVMKPEETALWTSSDYQEQQDKIKSIMMTGTTMRGNGRSYLCKMCGWEGHKRNLKNHIENRHIEGITYPCDFCGQTFKSDDSLRKHHKRKHRL